MIKHVILIAIALLSPLTLRAFEPAKPFPDQIKSARYIYSKEKINKGIDIIMGASVNEDLRFVFSGHQKGNNVSILFGVVGVVASATANGAAGQKAGSAERLTQEVSVPEIAQTQILQALGSSAKFAFDETATARFEMIPYAFLTRNPKTDKSKLHAFLKVKLYQNDSDTKPIWLTRFFGEASGFLDKEDLLDLDLVSASLNQAFARAAWAMKTIIDDDFETYKPVQVKSQFAGMKNDKFPYAGFILSEQNDLLLLRFPYSKMVPLAGYNVVEKKSATLKPLKKLKDKYKSDFER